MITQLKMINWRAYEEYAMEFKKGITFLMGANGSGKTSVLEAIAYALTGEAALFQKGERSHLLRNPDKPGTVYLTFEVGTACYEIMRTQNPDRAGDAYIKNLKDQKSLARTHAGVTKQVEKLLGISDDFLRRIIYMAEGDVFSFINNPPKDALDIQIRSVLGLTQLDQFAIALTASEKSLKNRLNSLQDLNANLVRLGVRSLDELDNKLTGENAARENFLTQLESVGRYLGALEQNTNTLRNFQKTTEVLEAEINTCPDLWTAFDIVSVVDFFEDLEHFILAEEYREDEIDLALANLDGQEEAYKKIIALLKPFEYSAKTVPCPVCGKPITGPEQLTITLKVERDVEQLNIERSNQTQRKQEIAQRIEKLNNQIKQLKPLRNLMMHPDPQLPGIHAGQTFPDLINTIVDLSKNEQSLRKAELEKRREEIKKRIKELDLFIAEYQVIKNHLGDFGFNSPEDLEKELIQIETRLLSLRAASQAIEETLQSQQNTDMKVIYEQIAELWSSFRGGEEIWEMEYNVEGYPVMTNDGEQTRLDLRQLSGGEKTALLIQLHTVMAHHFSQSDFLMIDEPLEHLDPVNRRSLIRFLVDAYHHQIFGQAIIATFEESLVRKYQSNEGVNIVLV
jgi:DNA repair exonuclease SbcCD ATPase subunit